MRPTEPTVRAAPIVCSLLALSLIGGCESARDRLLRDQYPSYPDPIRRAIDNGYLLKGMTPDQVYLVEGEPICKRQFDFKGKQVEVWLYPPGGRDPCKTSEFRVFFEDGVVASWEKYVGKINTPAMGP
ncbi:MAG: hypothetical protein AB1411_09435 [Nitrospirota bacterium]